MARPKDFKDIKLIKNYLKNQVVKKYNKLVRDKILEIIKKDGEIPFWRILNKKDFLEALTKKLLEEAKELVKAKKREEIINEIVDIQELIDILIPEIGLSKKQIKKLQKIKNKKRGSFKKRIFLIKTEKCKKSI